MKPIFIAFSILASLQGLAASVDDKMRQASPKECHYKITSGHRSKKHNKRVGGAEDSYHLKNRARDVIVYPKGCKERFAKRMLQKGLSVIFYNTHLHIDDRESQICIRVLKNPKRSRKCL